MTNNKGPSTNRCGIALVAGFQSKKLPFIITSCILHQVNRVSNLLFHAFCWYVVTTGLTINIHIPLIIFPETLYRLACNIKLRGNIWPGTSHQETKIKADKIVTGSKPLCPVAILISHPSCPQEVDMKIKNSTNAGLQLQKIHHNNRKATNRVYWRCGCHTTSSKYWLTFT